jgi:hypothetical protein
VDVLHRALGLLDLPQGHDERIDELLEVVFEERHVKEVVLDDVGIGLIVG